MTDIELKQLQTIIEKQLAFSEDNLQEAIQKTCIRKQHYQTLLLKETQDMVTKSKDLERLYAKLYEDKKLHSDYNWSVKEIEILIENDQQYYTLSVELNRLKAVINFLEKTVDNFHSLSFQIKNLIAWKNFQAGN